MASKVRPNTTPESGPIGVADLSVLIPARHEEWLGHTVADVLAHSSERTEIIVVLDGEWPTEPLPQHPRVTVLYHPQPVGQRAATNEAARVSTAPWIMKLDAHCSVAPGFDTVLLDAAEQLGPTVTQIPAQKNLHVYSWRCPCGWEQYQGPSVTACPKCDKTPERVLVWQARRGTTTTSWVLDSDLHFQYDKAGQRKQQGDICDVMTSLGACFFMRRDRFLEMGGLDEAHGSWGQFGAEIALKTWLSGGRHVVNKRTWFAHFFRVGGVGFPYPISGQAQEAARTYSRTLWRDNAWPGQVKPLRWLVEKFAPAGWTPEQIAALPSLSSRSPLPLPEQNGLSLLSEAVEIAGAGPLFVPEPLVAHPSTPAHCGDANSAAPQAVLVSGREEMAALAVGLSRVVSPCGSDQVSTLRGEDEVRRVAARRIVADEVIEDGVPGREALNQPRIHDSMNQQGPAIAPSFSADGPMSTPLPRAEPIPASGARVDGDLGEDPSDVGPVHVGDRERIRSSHVSASTDAGLGPVSRLPRDSGPSIVSRSALYYSDCRGDETILRAVRKRLRAVTPGIQIVAVTLAETEDWGADVRIVLPLERGYLTMFEQIRKGLTKCSGDVVHLCEHDVVYDASHFTAIPRHGTYLYNRSVWKVDAATGRALHYHCDQTSGLCAERTLLLEHYTKRVAHVREHGFSRRMGFEPGKPIRHGGIDDAPREFWFSERPNVDIRHSANLTPSRWRKDEFRNQKYTEGWTEGDGVPGWGQTAGRFAEFLAEATRYCADCGQSLQPNGCRCARCGGDGDVNGLECSVCEGAGAVAQCRSGVAVGVTA
jgi:hypothetical protein